jgi:hypothetical protein
MPPHRRPLVGGGPAAETMGMRGKLQEPGSPFRWDPRALPGPLVPPLDQPGSVEVTGSIPVPPLLVSTTVEKVTHLREVFRRAATLPELSRRGPAAGPQGPFSGVSSVGRPALGEGLRSPLSASAGGGSSPIGLLGLGKRRPGPARDVLVAQAVAVAFEREDLGVMHQAIDHRRRAQQTAVGALEAPTSAPTT